MYQYIGRIVASTSIVLFSMCSIHALAQSVDDDQLSELRAGDQKVSPEMISLVQEDVKSPVEEQHQKHQHLAKEQADQINKQTLEENAASDYELKKKTDNSKLLAEERKVYIPSKSAGVNEVLIRESSLRFNSTGNVKGSGTASVKLNNY